MPTIRHYRPLALLLAALLIPWLHGCAQGADSDPTPPPADSATSQAHADTTGATAALPDSTAPDTAVTCPPEVNGPVISLRRDTSERYKNDSLAVVPESGEFKGQSSYVSLKSRINKDSTDDIVIRFRHMAGNWGESLYAVYAGCEKNHYIRLWGPRHAFEVRLGSEDTVAGDWKPIRQFWRSGEEFTYVFSEGTYERLR